MPNLRLPVILVLAALGAASAAQAEPLSGSALQTRATGGEFRGDTSTLRGFESHIWRLSPTGHARAISVVKRSLNALSGHTIEFGDEGTWSIQGNTLCVQWPGENRRFSGCYSVEAQQGNHVRMVGPARWEGTLDR